MKTPLFKRIVLKLSGEVLAGASHRAIDGPTLENIAAQIREVKDCGVDIAVVVGGGNIIRGASDHLPGVNRIAGDYMGMLATNINALALKSCFEVQKVPTVILSAISVEGVIDSFAQDAALSHLEEGKLVIFAGGTGHPYFTTDTAAALRAVEIGADAILKGTKVDGVYSADPVEVPQATLYQYLSFMDVLKNDLKVMDTTAVSLCMEHNIPLIVFNAKREGTFKRIILGESLGTRIEGEDND
ncbi:MAG: UMP kinase [Gemmatimonadota bacterium]|nr:MAG: UMP kinase [Gemmatimonadota bacterium]